MDPKRRKELQEAYKNRHPEMGIICFCCKETGELFLGTSADTKAGYNSNHAQLQFGSHPNRRLQELWNQYGDDGLTFSVPEVLKYEDPKEDHSEDLEILFELCLSEHPQAYRIRG